MTVCYRLEEHLSLIHNPSFCAKSVGFGVTYALQQWYARLMWVSMQNLSETIAVIRPALYLNQSLDLVWFHVIISKWSIIACMPPHEDGSQLVLATQCKHFRGGLAWKYSACVWEDAHQTVQNHYYIYGWTNERTIGFLCFSSSIIWENSSISLGYGASINLEGPGMHVYDGTIGWCLGTLKSMSLRCRRGMSWTRAGISHLFSRDVLGCCYKLHSSFHPVKNCTNVWACFSQPSHAGAMCNFNCAIGSYNHPWFEKRLASSIAMPHFTQDNNHSYSFHCVSSTHPLVKYL